MGVGSGAGRLVCSPVTIWQYLEILLMVTAKGRGEYCWLVFSGWRPGILLNIPLLGWPWTAKYGAPDVNGTEVKKLRWNPELQ